MKAVSLAILALVALVGTPSRAQTDCAGPVVCPAICAPVCGSDGRTYGNSCAFTWAKDCKNSSLVEVSDGVCPDDTAWNGAICDSDPQDPPSGSSHGSHGDSGSGGSGSGGATNATTSPKPETPTVTSPGTAPVPAPSSGAASCGVVVSGTVAVVTLVATMV